MAKKPFSKAPLGEGGRFQACMKSGKSAALCATIGRNTYGKAAFQKLAAKGK